MDKNMINIDDMLKQRLGSAEEPERAGAWTNMRDLLDQQMPVNAGASTNWRRMFFYIAGVVLLATISVGGYQMVESFSTEGTGQLADNSSQNTSYTGVVNTAMNSLPDTRKEMVVEEPTQNTAPVKAADVVEPATNTNATRTVASNKQQAKSVQETSQPKTIIPSNGNIKNSNATKNVAATAPQLAVSENTYATTTEKAETTQPAQVQQPTETAQKAIDKATGVATTASDNSNIARAQEGAIKQLETAEQQLAKNDNTDNAPQFKEKRTPYTKLVMSKSIDENGEVKIDTIENTKEEKIDLIANNDNKNESALTENADEDNSGSSILPSSAAPSDNSSDNMNSANNNNGNVKAKKKKGSRYTNSRRFEEMVKNAKLSMGKVKFYPGVVAGANMAFSGSNINGFQLGLAGKLTLNERWSILTEAKYNHRFNRNERFQDDYITNVNNVTIGGQSLIRYDSVEHYYNFNTFGSIEMPISLSYNFNKVYVFGGVNLNYNFRINNIQEVELTHSQEAGATSTNVNVSATEKTVLLSDFKPSFGIGYVGGAGYEFNNKLRLDLRLTQPLYMNGSTVGQKQLADKLYKLPSMQANLTFRLGGNKFKPYKKR